MSVVYLYVHSYIDMYNCNYIRDANKAGAVHRLGCIAVMRGRNKVKDGLGSANARTRWTINGRTVGVAVGSYMNTCCVRMYVQVVHLYSCLGG